MLKSLTKTVKAFSSLFLSNISNSKAYKITVITSTRKNNEKEKGEYLMRRIQRQEYLERSLEKELNIAERRMDQPKDFASIDIEKLDCLYNTSDVT